MSGAMMLRMRGTAWTAGAAAAIALAACGGDDRSGPKTSGAGAERAQPPPSPSPAPPSPAEEEAGAMPDRADPDDVRVVRAWADTLRAGDVRGAARFFAIPSLVSNGTAPIRLETREEARFFNRTLPCGAKVIGTQPAPDGFIIVRFRLTERPGPGECGEGTGGTARTAFRVRNHQITDWLRVADVDDAPESLS